MMARAKPVGRPLRMFDLMVLTLFSSLPTAAVSLVMDGKGWDHGRVNHQGITLVLIPLAAGFVLWAIAEIAARRGSGWLSLQALAAMASGGVAYLGVAVMVALIDPYAASFTIASQVVMVVHAVFRP
ncbi:MAG: hypothetical protein AB7I30_06290 [Isosphaeraceae bacterium]